MKILYFILTTLVVHTCEAQQVKELKKNKDDNTLLWQISGNGLNKPSYLFGTIHMMCKEDINFSENLKNVFTSANEIYFEMDLDDASSMMSGLLLMTMKDQSLKDLYTDEEYNRVKTYFNDSLNIPFAMMQKMKPLFLQAFLYPKMMPCKNISSIEQELLALAKKDNKPIKGLETMEFQASVFDSIPYKDQAAGLLKSIDSINNYGDEFNKMVEVYKTQNLTQMQSMFNESDFENADQQAILLDNRNVKWVKELQEIMKEKVVFVAVGAGHLPGKMGVITLLRNAGYKVTPLYNK